MMLLLKLLYTLTVSVMGLILDGPHGIRQCQEKCRQLGGCTSMDFNPNLLQCTLNMNSSDRISIHELSVHWDFQGKRSDCRNCKKAEACIGKLNKNCVAAGRRLPSPDEGIHVPSGYRNLTFGRRHLHIKKHDERKTWEEARQVCQAEGGTLVKLDSRKKNHVISHTFTKRRSEFVWIGLHDRYENDTWYWTDGTGIGRNSNWKPNEPSKLGEESCGMMLFSKRSLGGKWYGEPCSHYLKFLCEWIRN